MWKLRKNSNSLNSLNSLYLEYNRREFVHPDPLEFLYSYTDPGEREIVGLIASSLAYGKVAGILKSVSRVLDIMKPSPSLFLKNATFDILTESFSGFVHRFATGEKLSHLLIGAKEVIERHGSLHGCFLSGVNGRDETILPALDAFARNITGDGAHDPGHLMAMPSRGSACKRLNLFLRWMVRKDAVDPGGWDNALQPKLIIPLDVHMHKICTRLGFTSRKQADMRTALEITNAFKTLVPEDPVRYDFALTRMGIRNDVDPEKFFEEYFRPSPGG